MIEYNETIAIIDKMYVVLYFLESIFDIAKQNENRKWLRSVPAEIDHFENEKYFLHATVILRRALSMANSMSANKIAGMHDMTSGFLDAKERLTGTICNIMRNLLYGPTLIAPKETAVSIIFFLIFLLLT